LLVVVGPTPAAIRLPAAGVKPNSLAYRTISLAAEADVGCARSRAEKRGKIQLRDHQGGKTTNLRRNTRKRARAVTSRRSKFSDMPPGLCRTNAKGVVCAGVARPAWPPGLPRGDAFRRHSHAIGSKETIKNQTQTWRGSP
jgi:hypothetical protein